MKIDTLFEDDHICCVNKPSGLVVNRAATVKSQTLQDYIEEKYSDIFGKTQDKDSEFYQRSGIVHRLDKETTGVIMTAKELNVYDKLKDLFKNRNITKTYLAIVHGEMQSKKGTVNAPIARLPWNKHKFGVVPGGKEAITNYSTLDKAIIEENKYSILEVYPKTGRTHQIRIHLKYINHAIVGDYLYGGRKQSRIDRIRFARTLLHAWKLRFCHPLTQMNLEIVAPIPDDIKRVLNK